MSTWHKWIKPALAVLFVVLLAQPTAGVRPVADRAFLEFPVVMAVLPLTAQENEIFHPVVGLNSVDMMDDLMLCEQPSDFLLHQPAVLKNVGAGSVFGSVGPEDLNVSVSGYSPPAFERKYRRIHSHVKSATRVAHPDSVLCKLFGWVVPNRRAAFGAAPISFFGFIFVSHTQGVLPNSMSLAT